MVDKGAAGRAMWGYIEGYYGRLFGWTERASLIDHLGDPRFGKKGAAYYLYAPKEDPLHRRDWRQPYPSEWRKEFKTLTKRGRKQGVSLVPGMAPGLSFDYLSAPDYRLLLAKLRDFQKAGCRTLALLMDDIPAVLPKHCEGAFRSLGEAHGRLLHQLLADLKRHDPDCRLWFCPTVYTDQFASGPVERDPYLLDLAATMPQEILLMWTGPRIIAERLDAKSLQKLSGIFQGNLLLWDNLYANDYCPNKIFLGPYEGRGPAIWKLTRGVLLNPTGLPMTDRLLLDLLAAFRAGRSAKAAWREALIRYRLPKEFLTVAPFLASPFFRPLPMGAARLAALQKALKVLIWDWKGVLHQEWYAYLFMLDADLKVSAQGKDKPEEAWVRKRYPPLLAELLLP
ncbi:MAG: beta-N-acetylglucosaminidase domain-containing protein [Fibrobacteria bacterium]